MLKEGLSFDDVLLIPKNGIVESRKHVNLKCRFSRNINLNIPIVSANMDTVTEDKMAIAMARAGGIGVIHRFLSVGEQIGLVSKVKRAESVFIDNPFRVVLGKTLLDVRNLIKENDIGGILVVDCNGVLKGIITARDLLFEEDLSKKVEDVMTSDLVVAKEGISMAEAKDILKEKKIEKLPIVDSSGVLKGLITTKDIEKRIKFPLASKDKKGRLLVGAAVGVKKGYMKCAEALVAAGVDVLVIDIAHGHSDFCISVLKDLKGSFKVDVIAGNVATSKGFLDLVKAGADGVKVGIGGGSLCSTRIMTGCGVPQLTAIMDCFKIAKEFGVPLVADGGVKNSGDIVKAIAAGADTVMIGNLFAGTDESPGHVILRNGGNYKVYRGMASLGAGLGKSSRDGGETDVGSFVSEGVEGLIRHKGSVYVVLNQLLGGLKSGVSYCGGKNLLDVQKNANFIKISSLGRRESGVHDVEMV